MAAFVWVLFAVTSTACVQLMRRNVPDFELNTLRIGVAFVAFSFALIVTRTIPVIPRKAIPSTIAFGTFMFLSSICYFVAVTFVPISTAQCLHITCAIISGMFLFTIFWEDKITVKGVLCAILCTTGVILVIQLNFIFKKTVPVADGDTGIHEANITKTMDTTTETSYRDKIHSFMFTALGYILSGTAGLIISCNLLLLKRHQYVNENKLKVLFWSFLMGTILSAIAMVTFERPVLRSSMLEIVLIILHVTPNIVMWPTTMYATQYISGNTFNIVFSTSVVFMLVLQYTLLSSILPGNRKWIEVVGVVLVLLGSAMASALEMCNTK